MREQYDLVVLMPVGPNTDKEFLKDTINSVHFYCRCKLKLVILDDSGEMLVEFIRSGYLGTDVIVNDSRSGFDGGLYVSLARAYKYVIGKYQFKSLLKIDTDALITGPDPQKEAEKLFDEQPEIGMAGLHKTRTEAYSFGTQLDNEWPRNHIMRATCTWRFIKRPVGNYALRKYFFKALANGYELGENVFGGAYFMNPKLLERLDRAGLLPDTRLQNSRLGEDAIFSLLAKVVNFNMGDLATGRLPFACAWKTLPASPMELHQNEKKIIHSTRSWDSMDEKDIRQYFNTIRDEESFSGSLINPAVNYIQ